MFKLKFNKNLNMEVEKIIQYLLIGHLPSGKIIYEMSNTSDPKTIFDINQIFNTLHKRRHHKPENIKVEKYNITISVERIIMISKTDDIFPLEQNFELFQKIKKDVPVLSQMTINWNLYLHNDKQIINSKIKNSIYNFFNEMNNDKQIMNTVSFEKNKNKINKMFTNNYYKEEEMNMRIRNSIINNFKSFDVDKYSFKQMIHKPDPFEGKNTKKNRKISVMMIDDINKTNKANNSKSLIQSSLIINNNRNNIQSPKISFNIMRELKDIIWQITCCKKIIFIILIIIIIAQIIAIPLIIYNSYSY